MTTKTEQEIGSKILARCAKCKDVTNHVLLSFKKEGKPGDVRCGTCGYEHGYRVPRMKKGSASSIASAAARKKAKADALFEELMKDSDQDEAKNYNMNESFHIDDIMNHKVFGLGKVIDIITPDKVVVHFREGQKILVCVIRVDLDEQEK